MKLVKLTFKSVVLMNMVLLLITSCDEFLGKRPAKNSSRTVESAKDLELLIKDYSEYVSEPNLTAIYSTDDYGFTTDLYDASPGTYIFYGLLYTFWDTEYISGNNDSFWSGEYDKIFHANLVLDNIGDVKKSPGVDKATLIAEAHFIRAYSYWELAQTYCLPNTEANASEPGLPLKTSTSFEQSLDRGTVKELYEFIESELKEALKISKPLVQNGEPEIWRASNASVNGFAARFYLQEHDYETALKYANKSLNAYNTLRDYNTEMSYGQPETVTLDPGTPQERNFEIKYPFTHDQRFDLEARVDWKEITYLRMLDYGSWWYKPSQDLLNLYDKNNDLRYKYHIVEGYSYDRGLTDPSYKYPGYIFFFKNDIPEGPTTPEMYLIKAEALARTNQVGPAMQTLNELYSHRVKPGTPALTAVSKDEAIKIVLQERRREMPFVHRWSDIRRFNTNDYPGDDVVPEKTFYPYDGNNVMAGQSTKTYTLEKNSRRYAAPIPRTEISTSRGEIEQNTY